MGLGKQLTTVTGGAGLATNLIGVFMADLATTASTTTSTASQSVTKAASTTKSPLDFSVLNNALATHNSYKVGEFFALFLMNIISVEVPVYDTTAVNKFPYEISNNLKNQVD